MSRTEEALEQVASVIRSEMGLMATAFRELRYSRVLESATFTFNAAGAIFRDYQVPYAAVSILSQSSALVTAANATLAAAAPAQGQGVAQVGPRGFGIFNLAGRSLTLYGNPGDSVSITVFASPQPPAAAIGSVALAGTATVAGTVTALTPATADIYVESPTSRLTNGNTANLTWPVNVTEAFVGVNVTAFAGGTNVQIFLDQQDANGIFSQLASSAVLTATGAVNFGAGPGQATGILLRSGGVYRLRWTVTGVFTTLTFQLGVTAR
jgi:hypothetical protein